MAENDELILACAESAEDNEEVLKLALSERQSYNNWLDGFIKARVEHINPVLKALGELSNI